LLKNRAAALRPISLCFLALLSLLPCLFAPPAARVLFPLCGFGCPESLFGLPLPFGGLGFRLFVEVRMGLLDSPQLQPNLRGGQPLLQRGHFVEFG
jgi:hypothetical protein